MPNGLLGRLTQKPVSTSSTLPARSFHIDIALSGGKPVKAPVTYAVNSGDQLEFSVTSDKTGAVGVPTNPPQTILFTQSPVVFRLTASAAGDYPVTYRAEGSQDVILIGTIRIKG
jgi:hypothetical protein